jgi:sugar lactone lactonase YvrE
VPELQVLLGGLAFPESPRWHDGRLWVSDWGASEILAVDLDGRGEVVVGYASFPMCIDWLPDGRLLIVSATEGGQVLQTIDLDRGCFACILGGPDGRTLFMTANDWRGPANMADGERAGQVLTAQAPAARAGWP